MSYIIYNHLRLSMKVIMSALLSLLLVHSLASPVQVPDSIGDGGHAAEAVLRAPEGVAVDNDGHIYVSERAGHRVRRIDARTGIITTFAGTGSRGSSGDGGPADEAMIGVPSDVAVDTRGNLYIAEPANHRIRVVDKATGIITTFAGTGEEGFGGDGGLATEARFRTPFGVSVAPDGSVYISDTDNHRIRRVDPATGIIETVAGDGRRDFGGDGGSATAASLARPHRVVVDADGTLYIGDSFNHRIRRVDPRTGVITTIAGTGSRGGSGDGGPATEADITFSGGLLLDGRGGLLYTDQPTHRIRRIDLATGRIDGVAGAGRWDFGGDGGPAFQADFHLPGTMALDGAGGILVVDKWNGRVRRVDLAADRVETFAGSRLNEPTPEVNYHFHHDREGEILTSLPHPLQR
jgi:DNA-binding beta-propeller fold protein YncE